jgi:tetratricopeptide (TPR) repeat protein
MGGQLADEPENKDLDLEIEDAGVAFRAEMWATDKLMRYYRELGGLVLLALFATLVYGQWRTYYQNGQRGTTSAIADIEESMPNTLIELVQLKAGMKPDEQIDEGETREAADSLLQVAEKGTGTASVEAALKAAELYRLLDANEDRRKALEFAKGKADGVLLYAAVAGLANIDIEEGQPDAALDKFKSLQNESPYLARQATLDMASALEALERYDEAVVAYDGYLQKFPDAPDIDDVQSRRTMAAGKGG